MAQKRYLDFFAPRSTKLLNDRWRDVITPGIYEGYYLTPTSVDNPNAVVLSPGKLVTNDGVVIEETDPITITGLTAPLASGFQSVWAIICEYTWSEFDPEVDDPPIAVFKGVHKTPGGEVPAGVVPDFDESAPDLEENQILIGYVVIPHGATDVNQDWIYQHGVARSPLGNFIVGRSPENEGIYILKNIGIGGQPSETHSLFVEDGIEAGLDYRATEDHHLVTKRDVDEFVGGQSAWTKIGDKLFYDEGPVGIGDSPPESTNIFHVEGNARINGSLRVDGEITHCNIHASRINAGEFDPDRIPELHADKITSGTFPPERIQDLPASKITSGIFSLNRIPNINAGRIIGPGTIDLERIPNIPANKIYGGASNKLTGDAGVPAGIHSHRTFLIFNRNQKSPGCLYGGTTDPTSNDRLNYDGRLYATSVFSNGSPAITRAGGNIEGSLTLQGTTLCTGSLLSRHHFEIEHSDSRRIYWRYNNFTIWYNRILDHHGHGTPFTVGYHPGTGWPVANEELNSWTRTWRLTWFHWGTDGSDGRMACQFHSGNESRRHGHLWIDDEGNLRWRTGTPSSHDDGHIIGPKETP